MGSHRIIPSLHLDYFPGNSRVQTENVLFWSLSTGFNDREFTVIRVDYALGAAITSYMRGSMR